MILRFLLALLLTALTGCSPGYFRLTRPVRVADRNPPAAQMATPKEKQARLKALTALIKDQQKIIDRYLKQDPANKTPDALLFVLDADYALAKTRLAKAQAEQAALGN